MKQGRPVEYVSRTLTLMKIGNEQIEEYTLSVFLLEMFHQYIFVHKMTCTIILYSDHKPLKAIVKKPMQRAPRRLQDMVMKIHGYDVEILNQKGTDILRMLHSIASISK